MKKNGLVPLVRAIGFGPLPQLLEERAGERALHRVLAAEGLPVAAAELGRMPIPTTSMIGLFTRAGSVLGDRTFGLLVGERMSCAGYGEWAERSTVACDLRAAIRSVNDTSHAHQTASFRFSLTCEGTRWIWRATRSRLLTGDRQHSDHQILPMIGFARLFLGPGWWPDWIDLDYARDADAAQIERRLGAPLRFERPGVGLALSEAQLAAPNPLWHAAAGPQQAAASQATASQAAVPLYDDVILADAPEPVRSFSAIVALRLIEGHSDIEGAARLAGIGVQGLQRRLRAEGFFYRELLELARRRRAVHLLTATPMPVAEIAAALGYEEHANFTRAFTRWTELSPSAFRTLQGITEANDHPDDELAPWTIPESAG